MLKLFVKALFVIFNALYRNRIKIAVNYSIYNSNLTACTYRGVSALLKHLNNSFAKGKTALCICIKVRAELSKGLKLSVLRVEQLKLTGNLFIALICALPPTRDTETPGLIAGIIPALKSSVSRNICPSVIEMTLVGMYAETSPA